MLDISDNVCRTWTLVSTTPFRTSTLLSLMLEARGLNEESGCTALTAHTVSFLWLQFLTMTWSSKRTNPWTNYGNHWHCFPPSPTVSDFHKLQWSSFSTRATFSRRRFAVQLVCHSHTVSQIMMGKGTQSKIAIATLSKSSGVSIRPLTKQCTRILHVLLIHRISREFLQQLLTHSWWLWWEMLQ